MADNINTQGMTAKLMGIIVALVILSMVLVPIVNSFNQSSSSGGGGEGGPTVINDGWVGADMEYYTDAPESAQTVTINRDTENITLSGGYSATYPVSDMILMVSDNQSLAVQNGMMYYNNGVTTVPVDNVTLTLDSSGLNGKAYEWVYFPTEDGLYHSYANGYNALRSDIVSVGSFDGVSVILNNGTVVDSTFDVTATPITQDDKVIGYKMFSVVGTTTPVRGMTDLWGFKIVDGEAILDKYYGEETITNTAVVIPSTVTYKGVSYPVVGIVGGYEDGYPASIIPNYLLDSSSENVTLVLPNTLEFIGDNAFHWNSAFVGTLTIPNSVTSIGDYAFDNCSGFTSLILGNSVQTIGDSAFSGCSNLTGLTLPNSLTSIGPNAFGDCSSLTGTLTIPDSVISIGIYAFDNTNLTYPIAPYTQGDWKFSIKNGGACIWSYEGDNFTAYPNSFVVDGVTYPVTQIGYGLSTIGVNSLDFPATVTTIGSGAFSYGYFDDNSVTIPNSVTTIGASAFEGCNLESVTLGSSVVSIGNRTFAYNDNLSAISIPDSVESIGNHAFYGCNLASLTLGESVTVIDDYAFAYNYGGPIQLIIPDSVEYIGKHAFESGSYTGDLIIGNSVRTIGDYAFQNFGGQGVLSLPDSLEYIGDYAFNTSYLTGSLVIPENVTYIGDNAFSYSQGFTGSLTIPDSVTYIGEYAFESCSNMRGELTLGNSVSYIGTCAFNNTYFVNSIIILSDSVTYVGESALPSRNTTALVNCSSAEFQENSLDMYGVKTVLNMVEDFELNTDSYGLNADVVMDGLTTAGVIQIAEEVPDSGGSEPESDTGSNSAYGLLKLVPIFVALGIIISIVSFIYTRYEL